MRRLQSDRRFRSSQQQFVVEGTRWMGELLSDAQLLQNVFYTDAWLSQSDHNGMFAQFSGSANQVSVEVMAAMSAVETPPGILATVTIDPLPIPQRPSLALILDAITNPGNLGTMLRTAAAAGVDALMMTPGCVDQYNPKVVRGSMGALLRLPVHLLEWRDIAATVDGMQTWVAAASGFRTYTAVDWQQPAALIVSNEARGASDDAFALSDGSIAIPMKVATESLNAAMAAGIILFEAARQRRLSEVSA